MKTILVSGASGIVGYGVLKSLRKDSHKYKLIGTTIYRDSIAPAFCDILEIAPLTSNEAYIDWLCDVIKKHKVDMIIPGINDDMIAWNKHRERLKQTGAFVLLNSSELIDLCNDKWNFYTSLQDGDHGFLIDSRISGTFSELSADFGIPFLLKPRSGFASKGIVIVDSEATFNKYVNELGINLMAQPIVGNKESEYTVSAFFDAQSSMCCIQGLRRTLSKEGFTEKAEVAMPPYANEVIQTLANKLKPIGPTNFQFRVHDNILKLLEINPRISSATSIRAEFGYNESIMSTEYFLDGVMPAQPMIKKGHAIRYTEDYIFYDSDNF